MMSENPHSDVKTSPGAQFGAKLQAAREALGLEPKDAAAQLRLNESVIQMIEQDCYSTNLHPTFLRGYIRAYGKLLQLPENEIKEAIEPIQLSSAAPTLLEPADEEKIVTTNNYPMRIVTYVIAITLMALVGIWWASHTAKRSHNEAANHVGLGVDAKVAQPLALASETPNTSEATAQPVATTETAKPATPSVEAPKPTTASVEKPEVPAKAKQVASANTEEDDEDEEA